MSELTHLINFRMRVESAYFGAYSGTNFKWNLNDDYVTWFPLGFDEWDPGLYGNMHILWTGAWKDSSSDQNGKGYVCELDSE